VSCSWFATEHVNELQHFEWLIVQHSITAPCQNGTLFVDPKNVDWDPEAQHTPVVKASLYPYLTRMYSCMIIISTKTTQPQSGTIDSKISYKNEE
jgi:hypothetical protein